LREGMRYAIDAGGKRLRPCLILAVGERLGAKKEELLRLACGIEMLHTASLIHDDLPELDNDALRRGQPTNHVKFGVANAILQGDAMINLAHSVLLSASGTSYVSACAYLSKKAGAHGMLGGQYLDVNSDKDLVRIQELKTAAMFEAAFVAGAICAGAEKSTIAKLEHVGRLVGKLFQVVDDLLDLGVGKIETGKSVGKDKAAKKVTYCTVYGEEYARQTVLQLQDEIASVRCDEVDDLVGDLVAYITSVV